MIMRTIQTLSLLVFVSFFVACSSSGGDEGGGQVQNPSNPNSGNPDPDPVIPDPKTATLVFPEHNTECNEGTNLTDNTSDVNFQWNLAADTDSYEVHVLNLIDESELVESTPNDNITMTILRGTPYSWHVISKASGTNKTASSSIASFYNAGEAIQNHAPFPATALSPTMGGSIDHGPTPLSWETSDIDQDITQYEVYFGTTSPPENKVGETNESQWQVTTVEGTKYFWKINTVDAAGNNTPSQVFEFRTK